MIGEDFLKNSLRVLKDCTVPVRQRPQTIIAGASLIPLSIRDQNLSDARSARGNSALQSFASVTPGRTPRRAQPARRGICPYFNSIIFLTCTFPASLCNL